ncbi:septation protein A [Thalassospira mesophila]|uniref:Inner membrane-spanning protein YciB n=1 Tax=Thalassospira mesophila TaxID=1293891 RepID=A0A1Y2KYQ2_9PROT|nr:septation protein A [Thalassospira mesophila]OSQ37850.1 septation protein A [Thalassospira mesophila]
MNHLTKLVLEMGPLVLFFAVNAITHDLMSATLVFVVATIVALSVSFLINRTVPVMPLIGGVFVIVFGGLTLYLQDDLFIKIKPTIVNLMFAAILFGGLATGRLFLKLVLESAFRAADEGWRILTWRWGLFFIVLAIANEIVWRNFSTDFWVAFKVWGVTPITLLFGFAQVPVILKYQLPEEDGAEA